METLGKVSGGDLRKAITCLQSAVRLRGSKVEPATILDVAGAVPGGVTTSLLAACQAGTFANIQVRPSYLSNLSHASGKGWLCQA